jgi:hypothetical protein
VAELKNIRFSFLAIAFLICNLVVLPFDFFLQLKITVPFWSFYLIEISFVFLILFAAFPKTPINSIIKISVVFLVFISFCFLLQGFLPFAAEHKILSFEINEELNSLKIVINLIGLAVLHILGCFLFASELLRRDERNQEASENSDPGSTLQYQRDLSQEHDAKYQNLQAAQALINDNQDEIINEDDPDYKENLSSLFDIYLDDYENNQNQVEKKIGNMENILLNNLKDGVTGAMCLNENGDELHDPVFHWEGFNKFDLIELYKANDNLSENLNEGALCQMLFCDNEHWYLVAKYRGNYLLLQTDDSKPDTLIENSFYLVQAIREFA